MHIIGFLTSVFVVSGAFDSFENIESKISTKGNGLLKDSNAEYEDYGGIQFAIKDSTSRLKRFMNESSSPNTFPMHVNTLKKNRLHGFLRNFRLNISRFDTSCLRREGRALLAPTLPHARIVKYTRRKNRAYPHNQYDVALYQCQEGFHFPRHASDRMFCSRNKWVGPSPVCLPTATWDETECQKCEQICTAEEINGKTEAVCGCFAGYEMLPNGTCVDVDECAVNNGGCSEICFNKPGSFQCHCPPGYRVGPDANTCIDRNECLLRNGHGPCQDTCRNTPGSYLCSCENIRGTRLSEDKHSCEDINECEEPDKFGCSHDCLNTFGNAFCTCPKGMLLSSEDYKTCLGEEDNDVAPENLQIATTTPPPVACPPGSSPAGSNDNDDSISPICVEHENCNVDNGGCQHVCVQNGDFRLCTCRIGYQLLNETACIDVNECEVNNGGCDHRCLNLPGSHYCTCQNGFRLSENQRSCKRTFCEPPPIQGNTVAWDCDYPSRAMMMRGNKPPVGTRCKLHCLDGYSLVPTTHRDFSDIFFPSIGNSLRNEDEQENSIFSGSVAHWIHCGENGEWEGLETASKSVCVLTSCPRLTEPENGQLFPEEICLENNVPLNTQCLLVCESGYFPKNGKIRTCSKGYQWFPEDKPACVKVAPTPRPYIHCPSDIQVDLKPGQEKAYVKIPQPQANMDWHRYVEATPAWAKTLEVNAPAGVTHVSFLARSPVSNESATCHFKIHVVDREAPRVFGCPTSFEVRISPQEGSREVWWAEPKFSDNVNLMYVQQSHTPGHALPRGKHHISYVAGDAEGNKARCSFTVTVHDSPHSDYYSRNAPSKSVNFRNVLIMCPNFKTGRWVVHYAYYLLPGCRYSARDESGSQLETRWKLYGKSDKKQISNAIYGEKRLRHF